MTLDMVREKNRGQRRNTLTTEDVVMTAGPSRLVLSRLAPAGPDCPVPLGFAAVIWYCQKAWLVDQAWDLFGNIDKMNIAMWLAHAGRKWRNERSLVDRNMPSSAVAPVHVSRLTSPPFWRGSCDKIEAPTKGRSPSRYLGDSFLRGYFLPAASNNVLQFDRLTNPSR